MNKMKAVSETAVTFSHNNLSQLTNNKALTHISYTPSTFGVMPIHFTIESSVFPREDLIVCKLDNEVKVLFMHVFQCWNINEFRKFQKTYVFIEFR